MVGRSRAPPADYQSAAGAASPDRAGACAQNANTTIARIGWHQACFPEKAASCIARTFVVKCWAHLPADCSVVGSLRTLALWPWQRFGVGRRCTETDAAPSARAAGNSHACSPRQSRLRRLSGAPQRPECRGWSVRGLVGLGNGGGKWRRRWRRRWRRQWPGANGQGKPAAPRGGCSCSSSRGEGERRP